MAETYAVIQGEGRQKATVSGLLWMTLIGARYNTLYAPMKYSHFTFIQLQQLNI